MPSTARSTSSSRGRSSALPERERTKHVHRLHPYLGKFIPQLVEALLARYVPRGGRVLDPFAGSGTTLVQALESGLRRDRRRHRRVQRAADAGQDERATTSSRSSTSCGTSARGSSKHRPARPSEPRRSCGAGSRRRPPPIFSLSARSIDDYEHRDVLRVVLARAARSARLTTHFDLDFPRAPPARPYWCHKHKRECRPVDRGRSTSSAATRSTPWRA